MASHALRREVLNSFKALHRTRERVFDGDLKALQFTREKINEGFKKNKDLNEQHVIAEQVQLAKGIEHEMRTTIIQAKEVKPGVYEARLTSDTVKMENMPYKDCDQVIQVSTNTKCKKQL